MLCLLWPGDMGCSIHNGTQKSHHHRQQPWILFTLSKIPPACSRLPTRAHPPVHLQVCRGIAGGFRHALQHGRE
eukprot:631421-Pelagomonas_calceolata.AAC.1